MARFTANEADNYSSGSSNFFSLKDDKDTARVRFLYGTIDDVEGDSVHEVQLDGKKRYVNCIRNYNEPADCCPLCREGAKVIPKLFIKLYNVDTGETLLWERGKAYFEKLASLASRYNPLYNEVIEIERNGKARDMQTTYSFYPIESSEFDINSIEMPDALGPIILDKSADDMETFIATGSFPEIGNAQPSQNNNLRPTRNDMPEGRRTPTNPNRRF